MESYKKLEKVQLVIRAILIGAITGIIVVSYRVSLDYVVEFRNKFFSNKITLIMIFLLLSILIQIMLNISPLISGSGIPQVMALLKEKLKFNYILELPFKFIGGIFAIFMGMSLGREGPSIHLGTLVSDGIIKIFKLPEKNEKFLKTAGASAGLAAAFNAPLAASVFAVEELHKKFTPLLLITAIISSVTSNLISMLFLGNHVVFHGFNNFYNPLSANFKRMSFEFILLLTLSLLMVIFADLFNYTLLKFQDMYKSFKINKYLKIYAISIISLIFIIYLPEITGGGHSLVEDISKNSYYSLNFLIILFIMKLLFTMLCYSTGAPGGIFLPMLAMGAILGRIIGISFVGILGIEEYYIIHLMIISMAAYFTAVVKAPITGIILVLEMTGNFSYLFSMVMAVSLTYIISDIFDKESVYEKLYSKMNFNKEKK